MTSRLRILLPSDVFPPRAGGAGWSAHTLALALIARGHRVTAIVPQRATKDLVSVVRHTLLHPLALLPAGDIPTQDVSGVPTLRFEYWSPHIPIIQNYVRYERFWPRLAAGLVHAAGTAFPNRTDPLIIHAQHVQSAAAAILAGRRLSAPVVITVRDHWPWDYFSTGLHADRVPYEHQTWASLATDLPTRLGPLRGTLVLPAIPYMLAHVQRRQWALRQASAVVAVSDYIAQRLRPIVSPEKLHVIPNMLDFASIDAAITTPQTSVLAGLPYMLFVGKLERNKGAQLLVDIFRAQQAEQVRTASTTVPLPALVVAGSGPLRADLAHELAALGLSVHFLDWVAHDEVLRLMAGCELLLFPSAWGEPLSRVPLEASACGAPILAMPTGGTPDIISDGVNGALAATTDHFARRLTMLLAQPEQRRALGVRARKIAQERFATEAVVDRVEMLYRSLLA